MYEYVFPHEKYLQPQNAKVLRNLYYIWRPTNEGIE